MGLDNPILVTVVGAVVVGAIVVGVVMVDAIVVGAVVVGARVVGADMVGAGVGGSGYSDSSSYTTVMVAADLSSTPVFVLCFRVISVVSAVVVDAIVVGAVMVGAVTWNVTLCLSACSLSVVDSKNGLQMRPDGSRVKR